MLETKPQATQAQEAPPRGPQPSGVSLRGLVVVLAVLAILFGGLFGWRHARTAAPPRGAPPPTLVSAITVQPQEVPARLEGMVGPPRR